MKKILVIEDDRGLREIIVEKLKLEKFDVCETGDGEAGWKMLNERRPDLIVLDIALPLLNGFDYLERLRKTPELSETPVIVLTNLGQPDDMERGRVLGVKDYLIKVHFAPQDLIEKVKQYI